MKLLRLLSSVLVLALVASSCGGSTPPEPPKEAVAADPAHYTVITENPSVRILRINYGPGEKSQMHTHPDAMVVSLGNSKTRFTLPDGTSTDSELTTDSAMFMDAATHNPENVGTTRTDAILIEFKTPAPGPAMLPAARDAMAMMVLAESPRASAYRITAAPAFEEPAGTVHDYDQVVIALGAVEMVLTIDGQPAKTSFARGDVQFIGRGVAHSSKNMGTTPADFVIVMIK
jgi:quercetin dioxygenase-like cupin family protein